MYLDCGTLEGYINSGIKISKKAIYENLYDRYGIRRVSEWNLLFRFGQ